MNKIPQDLDPGFAEQKTSDVRSFMAILRKHWPIVAVCVIIALLWGISFLRSSIYAYPVQMQLTTVQTNTEDSASSRLGGALGGLASLANVSLPTNQNGLQFRLYTESFHSRDIADEIAKNQAVMKYLFSGEWDERTQSWREPPLTDSEKRWLNMRATLGLAPPAPWHAPDGSNVLNFLNRDLQVQTDPRKPFLIKIILVHPDTKFAIDFLNLLNTTIDDHLRQKALLRARDYITYLSKQLGTVTVAEHRLAITQGLGEQERFAMVANSGSPFAADVFERPWASTLPASPSPRQILGVAALLGLFAGSMLVLIITSITRRWSTWRRSRAILIEQGSA